MKLLAAFLRLIRSVNLVFIAITQLLFQYCCLWPVLKRVDAPATLTAPMLIVLIIASVLIAAAGYIINDYFDLNIDLVNKPDKLVVDKVIRRRWAILWHMGFSSIGVLLSALVAWKTRAWWLIPANIGCVVALWFYSTTFKRKLLIGNVIISLLTAWSVLLIFFSKVSVADALLPYHQSQPKFFRFAFLYAGFAFILSLIREAIKDIEDMPGDAKYGCRTMPIVWGTNTTKVYTGVWLIILIITLVIVQVYVLQFRWWWAVVYAVLLIIAPLIDILLQLRRASTTQQYHKLSNQTKLVMLTGILSMAFFYYYL